MGRRLLLDQMCRGRPKRRCMDAVRTNMESVGVREEDTRDGVRCFVVLTSKRQRSQRYSRFPVVAVVSSHDIPKINKLL